MLWTPRTLDPCTLTPEQQAQELLKIQTSFAYFMGTYWVAADQRSRQWIRFETSGDWAPIIPYLYTLQHCSHSLLVNKSRGQGWTEIGKGRAFWGAAYTPGMKVGNASINQAKAAKFLEEITDLFAYWDALGYGWLIPSIEANNTTRLKFGHGGLIDSHPHTEDTARGDNYALFIADELGAWERGRAAWKSIVGAVIKRGGQVLAISTPKLGSLHEELVAGARQIPEPMLPVHQPWWPGKEEAESGLALPLVRDRWAAAFGERIGWTGRGHTGEWPVGANGLVLLCPHWSEYAFNDEIEAATWLRALNGNVTDFCEEYELTPIAGERTVFDRDALDLAYRPATLPRTEWFQAGHTYALGVDCSRGKHDYSVIQVLDCDLRRQVGVWRARVDAIEVVDVLSDLVEAARAVGAHLPRTVAIEVQGGGEVVVSHLAPSILAHCFRHESARQHEKRVARARQTGKFPTAIAPIGWTPTASSKPVMLKNLDAWVRLGDLILTHEQTVHEMRRMVVEDNGAMNAPAGDFDDCVIALGLAVLAGCGLYREQDRRTAQGGHPFVLPMGPLQRSLDAIGQRATIGGYTDASRGRRESWP